MGRTCHCDAGDPGGHVHLLSGPPHEPGCLGNHLGDCAVSGMFDSIAANEVLVRARLLIEDAKEMNVELMRRVVGVLDLHHPRTDRPDAGCIQCGQVYPCATVRLLREGD